MSLLLTPMLRLRAVGNCSGDSACEALALGRNGNIYDRPKAVEIGELNGALNVAQTNVLAPSG